jgi:hypothetical protein
VFLKRRGIFQGKNQRSSGNARVCFSSIAIGGEMVTVLQGNVDDRGGAGRCWTVLRARKNKKIAEAGLVLGEVAVVTAAGVGSSSSGAAS